MRILRLIGWFAGACAVVAALGYVLDPVSTVGATARFTEEAETAYLSATQFMASKDETSTAGSQATIFRFASVERGSIQQTVTVTGALQPVKTIEVGSQLSGQISKVYVDFNDTVLRDQPLAQIDARTFAAKVAEARSAVDMALAYVELEKAKLDRAGIDLQNIRANKAVLTAKLESAEAVKTSAQRTLARKLTLQSQSAVATTTVEDAQTDLTSRQAQEREAKILVTLNAFLVEGAEADVRRINAELEQARSAVQEKRAVLDAAEADFDRTLIRSPIDGVVVGRFINEGQTLAVGLESRTTFTVAHRLEDMEIHAQVDESDIGRVAPGQRAHFTVDAYPGRRFEAVVRQVRKAPQIQQHVVTYTVVLSTSNSDGALLPGMTAIVKIIIDQQDNVLKVPLAALRFQPAGMGPAQSPGQDGVWVRTRTGSINRVPVTVGPAAAEQVSLKSGELAEGNQVAVGQAIRPAGFELLGIRF